MTLPRLAVVCDFREENWPSMDLVAEMLLEQLQSNHADEIIAGRLCPPMRLRFTRDGRGSGRRFNADRLINRFWDYPRLARARRNDFDLFHVVDHSYAQLLHQLPPERTIVTCHDLDTFRCLLEPAREPRSLAFREMMKRTLNGFRKAALVTCDSAATRESLLRHQLVEPERAVVIHNGVHPLYTARPDPQADAEVDRLLGLAGAETIDLLHVGSTIERKRIDVLLKVFAALCREFPKLRLIRVGGPFNAQQAQLVEQLKLDERVVVMPALERRQLASVYRRAAVVLLPSEREGFGLPVVESLASGTPVAASDLPVLREVGQDAVLFCRAGEIEEWTKSVAGLLRERSRQPAQWAERRDLGFRQAARFSWAEYARKMVSLYRRLSASALDQ